MLRTLGELLIMISITIVMITVIAVLFLCGAIWFDRLGGDIRHEGSAILYSAKETQR